MRKNTPGFVVINWFSVRGHVEPLFDFGCLQSSLNLLIELINGLFVAQCWQRHNSVSLNTSTLKEKSQNVPLVVLYQTSPLIASSTKIFLLKSYIQNNWGYRSCSYYCSIFARPYLGYFYDFGVRKMVCQACKDITTVEKNWNVCMFFSGNIRCQYVISRFSVTGKKPDSRVSDTTKTVKLSGLFMTLPSWNVCFEALFPTLQI